MGFASLYPYYGLGTRVTAAFVGWVEVRNPSMGRIRHKNVPSPATFGGGKKRLHHASIMPSGGPDHFNPATPAMISATDSSFIGVMDSPSRATPRMTVPRVPMAVQIG